MSHDNLIPDQRNRLDEMLGVAITKPPSEQERYIRERCGSDDVVLREALALLSQTSHGDETTDIPVKSSAPPNSNAIPHDSASMHDRIGAFSIKSVIGSGGMGVVYLAVQENPHRKVALKVMKGGISSRSALRRFELIFGAAYSVTITQIR